MSSQPILLITREKARAAFDAAGLTYADINLVTLRRLRIKINLRMKMSKLIENTFRCTSHVSLKTLPNGLYATVTCKSFHFDKREAVSFNPDGFIAFAGWADDENVKPILKGFIEWVEWLEEAKANITRGGAA